MPKTFNLSAKPQKLGKPSAEALMALDRRWRASNLLLAPHRLGFFLAMVVLVASGLWWVLVQVDRVSVTVVLPYTFSPTLTHAAVMTYGFVPLFFSGVMFTAGPKWLGVEPLSTRLLMAPALMQTSGWLLWITGIHLHLVSALFGLALAWSGLTSMTWLFWRLIWRSRERDQLHARTIGVACLIGCISLAGLLANLVVGAMSVALACVMTGLWGFVVVVLVTVAHRMIPFFTSSAMPMASVWRPFWALGLMLAVAALECVAVWVEIDGPLHGPIAPVWMLLRGTCELAAGGVLVWLARVWGLAQSLKNRLLAMLRIGFMWLGGALLLGGASQLMGLLQGTPVLSLGALHGVTIGCLSSLMLAMVTRVSCGHSGRSVVADDLIWTLFWLLQLTALLRVVAAAQSTLASWLLLPTALIWAATLSLWGLRMGNWYGRVRADGRSG
jgi:uncharacterized protein involved in response to NO